MGSQSPSPAACARLLLGTMPNLMRHVAAVTRQQGAVANEPLSFGKLLALRMLVERPHSLKQLAAIHHVHPSTMSRSIEVLVRHGWVERRPVPGNRRQIQLTVSGSGREACRAMQAAMETAVASLMAQLGAADRQRVFDGLAALSRLLAVAFAEEGCQMPQS